MYYSNLSFDSSNNLYINPINSPNNVSDQKNIFKDIYDYKNHITMNNILNQPPILPIFLNYETINYDVITNNLESIHASINKLNILYKMDIFFNQNNFTYNIKSFYNDDFIDIEMRIFSILDNNNNLKNYKIDFKNITMNYFKKINNKSLFIIEKILNESNIINKKILCENSFINLNNELNEDITFNELKKIHIEKINNKTNFIQNCNFLDTKLSEIINLKNYIKSEYNNLQYFTFNEIITCIHNLKYHIYDLINNSLDKLLELHFIRLLSCIYKNIIFHYKHFDNETENFLINCLKLNINTNNNYCSHKAETQRNCIRILKFLKDYNLHFHFDFNKYILLINNIIDTSNCENLVDMCKICIS
jgi:hypothetical protein